MKRIDEIEARHNVLIKSNLAYSHMPGRHGLLAHQDRAVLLARVRELELAAKQACEFIDLGTRSGSTGMRPQYLAEARKVLVDALGKETGK